MERSSAAAVTVSNIDCLFCGLQEPQVDGNLNAEMQLDPCSRFTQYHNADDGV